MDKLPLITWFNFFVIFNIWMIVEFVFEIIKWYARASNKAVIGFAADFFNSQD